MRQPFLRLTREGVRITMVLFEVGEGRSR